MNIQRWFSFNWLKLLAIVMVLGALNTSFPYVYYQLMNWVVVGAALMVVAQSYQQDKSFLMWLFALVAVVFNPLAPLYLRQDVWRIVDITTAALFILSFMALMPKARKSEV